MFFTGGSGGGGGGRGGEAGRERIVCKERKKMTEIWEIRAQGKAWQRASSVCHPSHRLPYKDRKGHPSLHTDLEIPSESLSRTGWWGETWTVLY